MHFAIAMSICNFVSEVTRLCLEGTPIPSEKWVYLQFWLRDPKKLSALHHTGRFRLKFMIQAHQFQQVHVDAHYASALFLYQRQFAARYQKYCSYVFMDDKHHCKVGESSNPMAAVDRGKQVIILLDHKFVVVDQDHTKRSIVPSVAMVCNIPQSIDESFYHGRVFVGIKDCIFEPSSPIRHATELNSILNTCSSNNPILLIYSEGSSDHCLTYLTVQIPYICLFLTLLRTTAGRIQWRES